MKYSSRDEEHGNDGKYVKIKTLNTGAFATVDLAKDRSSDECFALKRICKSDEDAREVFQTEVEIYKKLQHRNIVKLQESYETKKDYVLVLEYGGPVDLYDLIHRKGRLSDEDCRWIFSEVLEAVDYCHSQGVYHRDIKPENILVLDKEIRLCDFGLATTESVSREFGYGSVSYMAPEVFGDYKSIDGYFSSSADVWALGVLLFNMKFGILPWKEASKSDAYFQAFLRNSSSFKKAYNLSDDFLMILNSVFDINPFTRCSVKKLKVMFSSLKSFCRKPFPSEGNKRRLPIESSGAAEMKERSWKNQNTNWAEYEGEMDFSKPLQFSEGNIPAGCSLSARVTKRGQCAFLAEMYEHIK